MCVRVERWEGDGAQDTSRSRTLAGVVGRQDKPRASGEARGILSLSRLRAGTRERAAAGASPFFHLGPSRLQPSAAGA